MNNKFMVTVYNLAKSRLLIEHGLKLNKRADILQAVEKITNSKSNGDDYNFLLNYGRIVHNDDKVKKDKPYSFDTAMKLAKKKAEFQPKLISMNSSVKFWSNDNG